METQPSLWFLNHRYVEHPTICTMLPDTFDWHLLHIWRKFEPGQMSWYVRAGHNFMPFHNAIGFCDRFRMPQFDPGFNQTFEQVTDAVCQQLYTLRFDRPWLVQWSGGIDSTVVMAALLRNLSVQDRKNITVCCNHHSVGEYPRFFVDCVQPHFSVVDSSWHDSHDVTHSHYVVNGEPGDQIFSHRYSYYLDKLGDLDWRKRPDELISFLTEFSSADFARWLYDNVKINIESVPIPVITYRDWFWWLGFNLCWVPTLLREHNNFNRCQSLGPWLDSSIHWFRDSLYQQWSMNNNNTAIKGGQRPGDDKIAAKSYIKSVHSDSHYHKFKSKVHSGGRPVKLSQRLPWVGILDDLSLLEIDQDVDRLAHLIAAHCKQITLSKERRKNVIHI